MSQTPRQTPPGRWAATVNMRSALQTLYTAIDAGPGCPRLALFYGPSGYGKTVAAAAAAAQTDAAFIRAESLWTQKSILRALARELGILDIAKTAVDILDQIKGHLDADPRPIIIDDMDNIVARQAVEVIRDIHDATDVPIMMIGEENIPAKLKAWERFDNRIVAEIAAQPSGIEDGRLLRDIYAQKVMIADDLVDYFVQQCRGVTRRIVINLYNAQRAAIDELDTMHIDRKMWGTRPVRNHELPSRRRQAA